MRARSILWMTPLALGLAFGCSDDETDVTPPGGDPATDTDGDGISDADEGAAAEIDSDGDGTPDYLDDDSDNDTILDAVEAGDNVLETPPVDSDSDEVPDFRDIDSDNNDILDEIELDDDLDGDGTGDYADLDNDGDGSPDTVEIVGDLADCDDDGEVDATGSSDTPADCDGDGVPNFMDLDSDDDLISDKDESSDLDTNGDSILDRYDLDTDGDGWLDIDEAGDDDIVTAPVDSDLDLVPDFRDTDSDADGLSDADELANGTDPTNADSDGDGVSDLVEVAAGTDPNDNMDNPATYGDFVFIVPFEEQTTPPDDTLEFATSIQFADLYFVLDTTTSMNAEFTALKDVNNGVPAIIDALKCEDFGGSCNIDNDCASGQVCFTPASGGAGTCIEDPLLANGGDGCIPDMWTGVGHFNDCNTYVNTQHVQADPAVTAAAVGNTGPGSREAVVQTPGCVADPSLCSGSTTHGCSADPAVTNPVGCAGYRPDAVRLLLQATDAGNQANPSNCGISGAEQPSWAGSALSTADIKFVGLSGTSDSSPVGSPAACAQAEVCLEAIGVASGTVDGSNMPFVTPNLNNGGSAYRDAIIDVVLEIARNKPLYATIDAVDEPGDAGDALQFLDYLEVNISGTGNCTTVNPTGDEDGDGRQDSFPSLLGGTPVCWDVHPVQSQSTTPPTTEAQLFRATLTVYGDGSPLDSRGVYFVVPPEGIDVPPPPQ